MKKFIVNLYDGKNAIHSGSSMHLVGGALTILGSDDKAVAFYVSGSWMSAVAEEVTKQ